ncbi:hypothetical protein LZ198_08115 [Myxococcus sp. K15C18031901]|uniref:hypothetical protein n=1 Tax=Myxococcus dinghuensis TaxID=2906761 RepID=UPI0020A76C7C|nr:hypothetical protein [Myxococcus dinghuensis]MCP3098839.1 hypothetical protein [Myxococcus dinghuensis]
MTKKMLGALVLSLCVFATACGDSKDKDDDGGGGGEGEKLQCHAVGWCTNWTPDDTEVTNAPAFSGGTLKDGLYRLEQGVDLAYAEAMYVQGNNILFLDSIWSNYQGTWKVTNGKLEVYRAATCDDYSAGPLDHPYTETYSFVVRGDDLFTQNDEDSPKFTKRWKRVANLCDESASFKCRGGGVCSCVSTTNKPLTGNENCTN